MYIVVSLQATFGLLGPRRGNPREALSLVVKVVLVVFLIQQAVLETIGQEVNANHKRHLPPVSFRFQLTMDTLAFGYVISAIRAYLGLAPVRQYSCRAY